MELTFYIIATARLAKNGNFGGIAAKCSDIVLHPLKSESLIKQTGILLVRWDLFSTREAKYIRSTRKLADRIS